MASCKPDFSLIIPVYNVEEYLPECLDSVLAQTFGNFELLAVDDGSTDNSPAILEQFAAQDARIRLLQQENAGPSAARNAGVAAARGEYCLFVDSDDVVHPQLLEICHHLLTKHGADFIGFNYMPIEPHEGLPNCHYELSSLRYHLSRNPYPLLSQRHRHRISLMTHDTCYRTSLAKKHPFIEGIIYEDYPHTVCLLRDVNLVISTQYRLYGYTRRPGSLMHKRFTADSIADYRYGLLSIFAAYWYKLRDFRIINRTVYPEYLKQIGNAIFRSGAGDGEKAGMLSEFRDLLLELDRFGLLHWRGHKLRRYFAYRKLLRTERAALRSLIPYLSKVFH